MNLKVVEDYHPSGKRFLLRFKEKGGKEKPLPVHHIEEILDQYLKATGVEKEPKFPLFPAAWGKTGKLSRRPLARTDAADMLKRRPNKLDCRLTIRLTQLYYRRGQNVLLEDMEPNPELGIMQSSFRPASRRETLGRQSKGLVAAAVG